MGYSYVELARLRKITRFAVLDLWVSPRAVSFLGLSLSQEIADGVSKSRQAVQAAEAGIRQIGSLARRQTMSMIQERANLPNISVQPVVAGAARKTSHAVAQATRTLMNMIAGGEPNSSNGDN
ncbi:hypothetical protein ACLOJK_001751 [Asimina triloba]